MNIIEYYSCENKNHWLDEIGKSDWSAGKYLYKIIKDDRLKELYPEDTKVLLLTEGEQLISFCIYTMQDNIIDPSVKPWVGFVYTYPQFRGKRRVGKLLEYAYLLAKKEGYGYIHLSTDEIGLYEKYGFSFWKTMKDVNGKDTSVYRKEILNQNYESIIGKSVSGIIDRPVGSSHPNHPEMIYPVNYGYVKGIIADDGEEQDVYVLGTTEKTETFKGMVVGVYHRLNDSEDKWIVTTDGYVPDSEYILKTIEFQEQYYMGELYL